MTELLAQSRVDSILEVWEIIKKRPGGWVWWQGDDTFAREDGVVLRPTNRKKVPWYMLSFSACGPEPDLEDYGIMPPVDRGTLWQAVLYADKRWPLKEKKNDR